MALREEVMRGSNSSVCIKHCRDCQSIFHPVLVSAKTGVDFYGVVLRQIAAFVLRQAFCLLQENILPQLGARVEFSLEGIRFPHFHCTWGSHCRNWSCGGEVEGG